MSFLDGLKEFVAGMAQTPEYQERHRQRMAELQAAADQRVERERRSRRQALLGHIAQRATLKASSIQKGRDLQYKDAGCKVRVKSGYDKDHDAIVTDVIVIDRSDSAEHYHLVIHEVTGAVLFEGWQPNH